MRVLKITLTVAALALVLSMPADSFAMGRRGDGGGSDNTNYAGGGQHQGHHQGSGHNNSQNHDQDHGDHDDDDDDYHAVGNVFFNGNDHHDPFKEESSDDPDDDDDEEGDSSDKTLSLREGNPELDQIAEPNDPQAIPEPATISLMLLGGAGVGLLRRKTKT